jgi:hypothetical protein
MFFEIERKSLQLSHHFLYIGRDTLPRNSLERPGEKRTAKPKREINNHQTNQDRQTPLGNKSPKKTAYSPRKQQRTFFKISKNIKFPQLSRKEQFNLAHLKKLIHEFANPK